MASLNYEAKRQHWEFANFLKRGESNRCEEYDFPWYLNAL